MANPFSLYFDGDLRRIYEVPENSSFVLNGGYRVYTPDDIPSAAAVAFLSTTDLWSRYVDFHNTNNWITLAMAKSGGAFREEDANGFDLFAGFDIRYINQWQFVMADYPHQLKITGNMYPDVLLGSIFDTSRLTAQGVIPVLAQSDVSPTVRDTSGGGGGLTTAHEAQLDRIEHHSEQANVQTQRS